MLKRYLGDEFDFSVALQGESYNEADFDLVYPLEWNLVKPEQISSPAKYVTGIRSHLYWPDRDLPSFVNLLSTRFQRVHVVSKRLLRIFAPLLPTVAYVTHGVDTAFFSSSTRADRSGRRVRIGWAGNRKSVENKGFSDILEPLGRVSGVEFVFCDYGDRQMSLAEMREFYNSLDICVCASVSEGNNNSLLEAAAMARAIVTTDTGTVPEYLKDGESAIIVARDLSRFVEAVERLRDDPARRAELGERARQAVLDGWDWKDKAEDYRAFFRAALLAAGPPPPAPLRLLLVAHGFPPYPLAGTELYTYNLARELRTRGHAVRVLCPEYDLRRPAGEITEEAYGGVPVTRLNLHPSREMTRQFKDEEAAKAFGRHLETLDLDAVHFQHLIGLTPSALHVCAQRGIATLLTLHDFWVLCEQTHLLQPDGNFCSGPETIDKCVRCVVSRDPRRQLAEPATELSDILASRREHIRSALAGVDALLVPTRFIREMLATFGFAHPHTVLAPLGVPPSSGLPWRADAAGPVRFTFLGNISFLKGVDLAVRAFDRIDPQKARLRLYGAVVDPAYWKGVEAGIKSGLRVEYHGAYSPEDLPEILARTDVAVIPSRAENYPTVIRECLHAGVPVIGPNLGGVPEIIQDGVNGLLFRPGDHEDLAEKLQVFIQNPGQVHVLRQGIQPVRTIAEDVTQLERIYRDVIVRRCGAVGTATSAGVSRADPLSGRALVEPVVDLVLRKIGPQRVLEVGCGRGFLVDALRERGVEAFGIDGSGASISETPARIRPYCRVASPLDPVEGQYDLVICDGVLDHLDDAQVGRAIANICGTTGDVLLLSGPAWFQGSTPGIRRPASFWVERFAEHGLHLDVDFDGGVAVLSGMRFRRGEAPGSVIDGLLARRDRLQSQLAALSRSARERDELIADLRFHLQALQQTVGWKALERLRRIRDRVAPPGSWRGRVYRMLLRAVEWAFS